MSKTIPKIIHYCWFGKNKMPESSINYIRGWKRKCPNYKIIKWSEDNFDVNSNKFTQKAYKDNNYAFVSDYVRLYVLYKYGGIYLDTDVELLKSLDPLLDNKLFLGLENWASVASGLIFGSRPREYDIYLLLKFYNNLTYESNNRFKFTYSTVRIITHYFRKLGLKYRNTKQIINGCTIYPTCYFCPKNVISSKIYITHNTYSIHHYFDSWNSHNKLTKMTKINLFVGDSIKRILRPCLYDFLYNVYLLIKGYIRK